MGLLRMAAIGTIGYVAYKYWDKNQSGSSAAFASDQGDMRVRNSGVDSMRDAPAGGWSDTDEALDQTFPASDPAGTY